MSGNDDSRAPQRRIDEPAKATFLAGLHRGESREDAAFAAGFSLMGFYGARSRDSAFKAGWTEALAASAAAERRLRAYAERGERLARGELRIASANRRAYQRRRRRNVRFHADAQAVYLTHFAAHCDTRAAAAAAGVHESTVRLHRRNDPAFAEAHDAALAEGYRQLEEETVRLRLAARKRLRAAIEAVCPERSRGAGPRRPLALAACPECSRRAEEGAEFERIMKLLARWDRKPRRPESGFKPGGQRQRWTFEMAMIALGRRLEALGIPIPSPRQALRK
jgi:hypothetical protein